jgi:hypothetical protein
MPHCKKYGAVFPPSPKRTEQDMPLQEDWRSPNSSNIQIVVGRVTGYRLDDRRVGVQVLVRSRI